MTDLKGKVVLVAGAGRGAGRQVAESLAALGAVIAAVDLTPVNLDDTVARITAGGGRVTPYLVDIARKMPVQGLLNQVVEQLGGIHILVNCAEVEPSRKVLEMDEWEWARTMEVNLTGAFLLTQSVGRIMKETGGGLIIHVSRPALAREDRSAYRASKSALETFVRTAAGELASHRIRLCLAASAGEVLELCRA